MANLHEQERSFGEASRASRDAIESGSQSYLGFMFRAQQEFFQFGVNLLQREIDTGRRIAGARNVGETFSAYNELVRDTVQDFAETTTRLIDRAYDAGSIVSHQAQEAGHAVVRGADQSARAAQDHAAEAARHTTSAAEQASHSRRSSKE